MRRLRLTQWGSFIFVGLLFWQTTALPTCFAAPPSDDYQLVWQDEFDGTELDKTKWAHRNLGPRRDAINTESAVTLDGNGHLLITTSKNGDKWETGMIGTNGLFSLKYGYLECRVEMQKQIGHWSAFWMMPDKMGVFETPDPRKGGIEIDIYEYLRSEPQSLKHNLHWNGYKAGQHQHVGASGLKNSEIGNGFHTFAVEWTPEEFVFFCDGKETWRTSKATSDVSSYIILSCEVGSWGGDIKKAALPDSCVFDYVRVYQKK